MAEPHNDTGAEQAANASKAVASAGQRVADGERRSFQDDARQSGRATSNGGSAPTAVTRDLVDAGRDLAMAGRQAAFAGADLWGRSMEPVYALQMEMLRWFDGLWRQTASGMRPAEPSRAMSFAPFTGQPPADVVESGGAYTLSVELPGLALQDVDVSIVGDRLTLTGHKAEARDERGAAYRLSERRFGRFERSFPLPPDVERGKVEAAFKDGVLRVVLPKDGEGASARSSVQIRN